MFKRDDGEAIDPEAGLAARAAWLSYVGGYRQEDIAERLHVSRVKVNRLIAKAHRRGMVRVFVEGTAADCVALEDELARRFGLKFALVAPNLNGGDLPLATLGSAGSRFLHSVLEDGPDLVIGVGHGRTIAAVVDNLPRVSRPGVRCVSLLGGIVRNAVANPFDDRSANEDGVDIADAGDVEVGLERVHLAAVSVATDGQVDGAERALIRTAVEHVGGEQDQAGTGPEGGHASGQPLSNRLA